MGARVLDDEERVLEDREKSSPSSTNDWRELDMIISGMLPSSSLHGG
jgi:hypothetical protein